MAELNLFDTYTMMAVTEQIPPVPRFFKDRYFETGEGDIFASDKVVTEYRNGDQAMAPFVSRRVGDIPVDREGYSIHEYQPAFIAPSRMLTVDELTKRGFGEALYANSTPAQRAVKLQQQDLIDLDRRIQRREEWMCVQTMINNACEMQSYVDGRTKGEKLFVSFYDDQPTAHKYTVAKKWDEEGGNPRGDVIAMCRMLTRRGLPAADLILGTEVAECLLANAEIRELLNKTSGIITGQVLETLTQYDGVVFMGVLNFGGNRLNLFSVDEQTLDDEGKVGPLFPAKGALVTAPGCGHMAYGQITQIDYGSTGYTSHAATRVPKFSVDQPNDVRKLRLAARPIAMPKNYCPWIYAEDVVGANP